MSGRGDWCGGLGGVGVAFDVVGVERVRWFRDEVGNFFYNSDMRNSKTVMTGEAVDNLWITCG